MKFNEAEVFIYSKLQHELSEHLYYHSIYHVKDVLYAATKLAEAEGIDHEDLLLLKTAVLLHDIGFTVEGKNHEEISCDIAMQELPKFGYTHDEINKIEGMIMATKIPQKPHTLLEKIIADADLDYLGRDDYWEISNNLYREINIYNLLSEEAWLKLQISFLEQHSYFTETAIKTRKEKKAKYLVELKANLLKHTTNS